MTVVLTVPAIQRCSVANKKGKLNQAVGRSLRAHRERLGYSQEGYAHELGVDRAYWARIERGEMNLSLDRIEALSEQIGIDAIQLFGEQTLNKPD